MQEIVLKVRKKLGVIADDIMNSIQNSQEHTQRTRKATMGLIVGGLTICLLGGRMVLV